MYFEECTEEKYINIDLKNRISRCGLDTTGSELEPVVGSCEQDNEILGSTNGNFLTS
jgi:hypothetical protein